MDPLALAHATVILQNREQVRVSVSPRLDTAAIFLSDMEHEVAAGLLELHVAVVEGFLFDEESRVGSRWKGQATRTRECSDQEGCCLAHKPHNTLELHCIDGWPSWYCRKTWCPFF